MRHVTTLSLLLHLSCAAVVAGQSVATNLSSNASPNDSIFRRARQLVSEGNGSAGRAIVDSLLERAEEGSPSYGNALYWRGALSETAAAAERDYRRVIVEYPLSAHSDDALLAIAELEQARGDRADALAHYQRFVKEHPMSPVRGTAALAAARLAFEQRDTRVGCAMIIDARTSVPSANVELHNQIDYLGARCIAGDTSANTAVATAPIARVPAIPVNRSAPPVPAAAKGGTATTGRFTIQLAAYNMLADARRFETKLRAKGVHARVSGETRPFRVRLDFYRSRKAALDEVAALRRRGIIGFVTTEESPPEHAPP